MNCAGQKLKALDINRFRKSTHKMSMYNFLSALGELDQPKKQLALLEDTERLTRYEEALKLLRKQIYGRCSYVQEYAQRPKE